MLKRFNKDYYYYYFIIIIIIIDLRELRVLYLISSPAGIILRSDLQSLGRGGGGDSGGLLWFIHLLYQDAPQKVFKNTSPRASTGYLLKNTIFESNTVCRKKPKRSIEIHVL